jgi:hypothetical protein
MKGKNIRILVANSSAAHLYNGDHLRMDKDLDLIKEYSHPESRMKGSDLVSDRPGTAMHTANASKGTYSNYESKHDPKEVEAENFALELTKDVKNIFTPAHSDDELVIVAPAHFSKHFKKHWHGHAAELIHIPKDYVHLNIKDLSAVIREHLYGK